MTKILWALVIGLFAFSASAEIKITGNKTKNNPAVYLEKNNLPTDLNTAIRRKIVFSDWFSLTDNRDQAVYILSIQKAAKTQIRLKDKLGNTVPKCGFDIDINKLSPKWRAHLIVDELIKRFFTSASFPDPRICASQIAFSAWSSGKKEIYLCDVDGSNLRKKTNFKNITVSPKWSPDNRYLLYTVYGKASTSIFQMDLNTNKHRILTHYRGMNTGASFRPKSNSIIMTLSKDRMVDLYWMDLNNIGKLGRLTKNSNIESSPIFSPAGNQICYVSSTVSSAGKVNSPKLQIMNASNLQSRPLFKDSVERVSPDWSKTTGQLVYSKKMGSQYVLAVCDPKNPGGTETIITRISGHWEDASWAPDGRHIVCTRDLGGDKSLYIVDSLYKTVRKLNLNLRKCSSPSWSNLYK